MRTCPACSGELREDSSFCPACGTPVHPPAEEPTRARREGNLRSAGPFPPADFRLAPGRVLAGHYQLAELLGKGGMGEVYRARDEKLGRDVALKVVRQDLAGDPERLARIQREARLLAALNHPNLAQLYTLEEDGGVHFLTMELVPGPTLAQRLQRGRPAVAEALRLARQLAEALEAAHERGVVHRDLKPANVKVTPAGQVKVLDFGLAKLAARADPGQTTLDPGDTREGIVLGTPAYMSPEQARGQPLDKRADVWSFGCVLYELLAGGRAFGGGSGSDVIAAVLRGEPDWQALPAEVPPAVRDLVRRCLRKDAGHRLRDIGDARLVLEEVLESPPAAEAFRPPARRRLGPAAALGGLILALLAGVWLGTRLAPAPRPGAEPPEWAGDFLAGGTTVVMDPRVSPDGRRLAFITLVDGQAQVAVMDLGSPSARTFRVLTTRKGAGAARSPCWSRDGTRIYFYRYYAVPRGVFLVRADEDRGEETLVLADAGGPEVLPDGDLLVDRIEPRGHQLYRLSLDRATLAPVGGPIAYPNWLCLATSAFPDGKEVVFVGRPADDPRAELGYLALDLGTGKTRRLGPAPVADPALRAADLHSFYAVRRSGDLYQVVAVPREGEAAPRVLLTLPWAPAEMDVDHSGTLYLRHVERPDELLRFPVRGGVPTRLLTLDLALRGRMTPLPDGQVLVPTPGWGTRVQLVRPGERPRDFVQTNLETSLPAAALGKDRVALLQGRGPGRKIIVVKVPDGRVVRRLDDSPAGPIQAMAGAPDGRALFIARDGWVWRISLADSKARPKKLCPGLRLAPDPNGRDLIVLRLEKNQFGLVRVPLEGGRRNRSRSSATS